MSRAAGTYAIFETSQGNIVIRLLEKEAPKTVENFIGLAEGSKEFTNEKTGKKEKRNFYDGLTFHRVIPQFMIQGGCPQGTGTGSGGYTIKAEFNKTKHAAGVLSMARSNDPNSAGTQFFICHEEASFLDGKYTAFGKVKDQESQDTVNKIAVTKTRNEQPVEKVVIEKAVVKESGK